MPVLDPLLKINYVKVNVWNAIGNGTYKLEKTVYVSPSMLNGGMFITIDGGTYGPLDHECLVFENQVVGGVLTTGSRAVLNLERGNSVPLKMGNTLKRDARAYEEAMRTQAQINMLRNKESDKWRKQFTLLIAIFMVGILGLAIVFNIGPIMTAIKGTPSSTTPTTPTGPRLLLYLWRFL